MIKLKIIDKLIINKKVTIFLLSISFLAIITGTIFVIVLGNDYTNEIKESINNFINNLDKINYIETFKNIFLTNLIFLILIWLIGISIIGIPISLILFFIKCFSLGFTIGSFILVFKTKGILLNIIYIIPSQIINILITIYLLSISLIISFKILESLIKKKTFSFNFMNNYKKALFISILVFLISNLYETFIVPYLFNILHLTK